MNTSDSINEIATALAKAQGEIQNPAKNRVNPHFKSKYADIADGLDVIRPTLSKHGVAFIQATEFDGENVTLRTRLLHTSGQWIESSYPVGKFVKHQELGASLTYAKRQALFSIVGVAGDDDDDGNSATATPGARKSSAAMKREDIWPGLEKAVRAATTKEELNTLWREKRPEMASWPVSWVNQAEDLFKDRVADLATREDLSEYVEAAE
jgi:hypothetical protein